MGWIDARIAVDASGATRGLGSALDVASPARSPRLIARYGYMEGSCLAFDDAPSRVSFDGPPRSDWTPRHLLGLKPRGPSRGDDVTWRMSTEAAGPGWFTVGDAAATLDPTSSHGVLKAIMSGMMAGRLIAAVLGGKAPGEATAAAYREWLAGWFSADAARLAQFYRSLGAAAFG